ncbi:MAG: HAMP domain-containing histidine kinase, partial [Candidatus Aminicenantes bacterium]|nr:HAMP domain-containing histidine kinase [Candidatus Aminicenantes bacterium]
VTNLLGVSRLELQESKPKISLANLAPILRSVVKSFKEKADKKNLDMIANIPESLTILADPGMMQVVFNNLLENALKYTNQGKITVNAHEDPIAIIISIRDTGIGIPENERSKIFEKFYRGRAPEVQNQDGVGIGLHITKRYVEQHGGTITYEPLLEEKTDRKGRTVTKEIGSLFTVKITKRRGEVKA